MSRLAAPARGSPELPVSSSDTTARPSPRLPSRRLRDGEGIHYLPNDNRRFPICGSWRSNWNHTGEADRATCPDCRARLAEGPPPDGAAQG